MANIIVPEKLTEKIIEELIKELYDSPKEIDLQLPTEIDYRGFGIFPLFFLMFFTWLRRKNGKIILAIDINDSDKIKGFAFNYFGYIISITSWKHCEIENSLGLSLKKELRKFTPTMHEKIDFLSQLPLDAIAIPNFDHYSKTQGLSHWFYNNEFSFFDSPSGLENTLYRILQNLSININAVKDSRNVFDKLQEILWELMKNTDDHAILDYLNETNLTPNTRGVYFRIQKSSKANLIKAAKEHKGLANYYESVLTDGLNYLLEFSVLDSGPGLVKRFLGKSWIDGLEINNDVKIIKQCLVKGQTSVENIKGNNKGYGLDNVLKLLDQQKGFLKIRTGRASLYRDLTNSPYLESKDINNISLYDWSTCSKDNYRNMQYCEGTLLTMVYPLNITI